MTYAIEYFAGPIHDDVAPADVAWQRLAKVVGVDYEDIADVLSLVADLEFCEENRGKYRVVEVVENPREVMCCSCGDTALEVPEDMPAQRALLLPPRVCRSCGLSGKLEVVDDDGVCMLVFGTDESEAETWKLVDALMVDMADEILEQIRSEKKRQRGWQSSGAVWGPQ